MLPPHGSVGPCSGRLQETRQALDSLQNHFQTHVEQIQQVALHPCLCPQKVQELLEHVLSQLLVRMSTLQAKGHMQLDTFSRYDEHDQLMKVVFIVCQNLKAASSRNPWRFRNHLFFPTDVPRMKKSTRKATMTSS